MSSGCRGTSNASRRSKATMFPLARSLAWIRGVRDSLRAMWTRLTRLRRGTWSSGGTPASLRLTSRTLSCWGSWSRSPLGELAAQRTPIYPRRWEAVTLKWLWAQAYRRFNHQWLNHRPRNKGITSKALSRCILAPEKGSCKELNKRTWK